MARRSNTDESGRWARRGTRTVSGGYASDDGGRGGDHDAWQARADMAFITVTWPPSPESHPPLAVPALESTRQAAPMATRTVMAVRRCAARCGVGSGGCGPRVFAAMPMDERRSGAGWLGTVITASGEGGSGYTRRSPP